jgi:SPFH domain / Band 7 family
MSITENRWLRSREDVAKRLEVQDLPGKLEKGIEVQEGTQALLIKQGSIQGTLSSGYHNLRGLKSWWRSGEITAGTSVVLVDSGDIVLEFSSSGAMTKDSVLIDINVSLVVRIVEPYLFLVNVIKDQTSLMKNDLSELLDKEIVGIVGDALRGVDSDELYSNSKLKDVILKSLENNLRGTLNSNGMLLVQIRAFNYSQQILNKIEKLIGDKNLEAREEKALLEQRKGRMYAGLEAKEQDLEKLITLKEINDRARETLTSERLEKIKTEEDLARYLYEVVGGGDQERRKQNLIRTEELEEMKRIFNETRTDREFTRRKMLARLNLAFQQEMERVRFENGKEMDHDRLEHELALRRREFEVQMEEDWIRYQHDSKKETDLIERDLAEARAAINLQTEIRDAKREAVRKDSEMEIVLQGDKNRNEAELLETRSRATAQALLSIIDGDSADRIADLEKLRLQQGMSEDQLVVLTASESPDTAAALSEKYKAQGKISEEQGVMLEKQIDEAKRVAGEYERMADKHVDRMARLMEEAMRQISRSASGGKSGTD